MENWIETTVTILIALHALATIIVNITPTPKDNAILSKVYGWIIEPLAGIVFKNKVKQ